MKANQKEGIFTEILEGMFYAGFDSVCLEIAFHDNPLTLSRDLVLSADFTFCVATDHANNFISVMHMIPSHGSRLQCQDMAPFHVKKPKIFYYTSVMFVWELSPHPVLLFL